MSNSFFFLLTLFFNNVKVSIWNFLICKKNAREKVNFFKMSRFCYFLLYAYHFSVVRISFLAVLRYISLLSKMVHYLAVVPPWSIWSKYHDNLNVKCTIKLNSRWKLYGLFSVVLFFRLCRTLSRLSKMVLANVGAFAVLKILHKLVSIQMSLFANNCWSKQNYKKCTM